MSIPAAGTLLANKYRVTRLLGEGGMGLVVEAVHEQLDQKVAIKFLRPEALAHASLVARFAREARSSCCQQYSGCLDDSVCNQALVSYDMCVSAASDGGGSTCAETLGTANSAAQALVQCAFFTQCKDACSYTRPRSSCVESDGEPSTGWMHDTSFTFPSPGAYGFYCNVHGSDTAKPGTMTGVVYVDSSRR